MSGSGRASPPTDFDKIAWVISGRGDIDYVIAMLDETVQTSQWRRQTRQDRSAARQDRIAEGAIAAISRYGIDGVTHRRVAQEAGVSLAATTYHYQTKADIIADASRVLLARYVDAFRRFAAREQETPTGITLRDFAMKLVFNAVDRHGVGSAAWCEIILNAARRPDLIPLSKAWFETLETVWREIAVLLNVECPEESVRSAMDAVIGFLFLVAPLGLDEDALRGLLSGELVPPASESNAAAENRIQREGRKAEETRERLLKAAVDILIAEGVQALSFRSVAQAAGLTTAAPAYYFTSIAALIEASQQRLAEHSRLRYRSVMGAVDYDTLDIPRLVDLTTTVFLREATEFRAVSLAAYPLYVAARREPTLRAGLWTMNAEQQHRWWQVLNRCLPHATAFSAWTMYAVFAGKLVRIVASGSDTAALANVRGEFAHDLSALASGSHWSHPV